jgi:hypothetical protein
MSRSTCPFYQGDRARLVSPECPHGSETSRYGMAIRGVSVSDEVLGCLIPGEGLGDLAGDPFGGRIGCDVDPDEVASLKLDDHQAIEQLEANGRHDKQYQWR